jgi:hypothetical protein
VRYFTIVRAGGLALILGALAFLAVFSYLAARFGYPDVLDGVASEVLPRLLSTGSGQCLGRYETGNPSRGKFGVCAGSDGYKRRRYSQIALTFAGAPLTSLLKPRDGLQLAVHPLSRRGRAVMHNSESAGIDESALHDALFAQKAPGCTLSIPPPAR